MAPVSMRRLLDAGMHFGHQTRRWNPKMRRFIHDERHGIYVVDLIQSQRLLEEAANFVGSVAAKGGTVLFVGTKKQAQDVILDVATRTGMPYVNYRWLGGVLTNWKTMSDRLKYLLELRHQRDEGQLELLGKKERMVRLHELTKLEQSLGGLAGMEKLPDVMVVIDTNVEALAVKEARRCKIPIVGLIDTNSDPDVVDYVVPGNDDAIRSCTLFIETMGDAISNAKTMVTEEEFAASAEDSSDDDSADSDREQVAVGATSSNGEGA